MKLGLVQNKDAFIFVVFCGFVVVVVVVVVLYLISLQLSSPFSFLAEQSIMFHHRIMLRACHAKNEFGMQPFEFLFEFTNSSVSSSLSVFLSVTFQFQFLTRLNFLTTLRTSKIILTVVHSIKGPRAS